MRKHKQKKSQTYKYRILEYFNKLPIQEAALAKNRLPIALEVNKYTFRDWCYLKSDDSRKIPSEALYQIASYFGVDISDMFTEIPPDINHNKLKDLYLKDTANNFNIKTF